jgi:hypothetical protein
MSKKRFVIAGMGVGGLRTAKALAGSDVEFIHDELDVCVLVSGATGPTYYGKKTPGGLLAVNRG